MLAEIISNSGLTQAAWADRLGVSRSYLSELISGKRRPSLEVAAKIEQETRGAVMAASWIAQCDKGRAA